MNFFIALGITTDIANMIGDGVVTESNNFSVFNIVSNPEKISVFYIGY